MHSHAHNGNIATQTAATALLVFVLVLTTAAILAAAPGIACAKSESFVIAADPHVRFQGDDRLIKNNADTLRAFANAQESGLFLRAI